MAPALVLLLAHASAAEVLDLDGFCTNQWHLHRSDARHAHLNSLLWAQAQREQHAASAAELAPPSLRTPNKGGARASAATAAAVRSPVTGGRAANLSTSSCGGRTTPSHLACSASAPGLV